MHFDTFVKESGPHQLLTLLRARSFIMTDDSCACEMSWKNYTKCVQKYAVFRLHRPYYVRPN